MLISYNWLQTYFKEKLPPADKVAEVLIFHSFEIESVEKHSDDFIFDVKVLPDRAHDCLSHRGVARELSVHLGTKVVEDKKPLGVSGGKPKRPLSINVKEPTFCLRYTSLLIEGIKIGPSPGWLKSRLESIGQKSINNVVDATNLVMFDLGQPLHAFDADKVKGGIEVRMAKDGEKITTLGGKEITLEKDILVIADDEAPLAIAGIKGGKKAEVDAGTKNIILEAANFSPVSVRKTSKRLGIQTDSSKRFENELSPETAKEAIEAVANLILEIAGGDQTKVGDIVDFYPRPLQLYKIGISVSEVNDVLGTTFTEKDVVNICNKFNYKYELIANTTKKVLEVSRLLVDSLYKRPSAMQYDAPKAFSCTSLISYVFVQAGIYMPSLAIDKYAHGTAVEKEDIKPGDIVFVNTNEGSNNNAPVIYYETVEWMKGTRVEKGIDHAGIYLGDGEILHTSWKHSKAVIEKLETAEQFRNIIGYRRFINDDEKRIVLTIPHERLDLRIKEDLIEEIGKTYGYDKITTRTLPATDAKALVNKSFFYANKIRNILAREGFSEVYTSSFADSGKVAVENPIASDKGFLRENLSDGLFKSLELNSKNAPLLGLEIVKIFEIGKTFKKISEEKMLLAMGVCGKKPKEALEKMVVTLKQELNCDLGENIKLVGERAIAEIDFDALIENLPEQKNYGDMLLFDKNAAVYKKISSYPFILRDIALWVPENILDKKIAEIIKEKSGELLANIWPFDVFKKGDRTSYAFRLVFQSQDRTLTDDEINKIMDAITKKMISLGFEVR